MIRVAKLLDNYDDFGAIAPLLADHTVNDILVNGYDEIYVERDGVLEKTDIVFKNEKEVNDLAHYIVNIVGRTLDEDRPMVDARLSDGSRVNIIAPPLAVDGTTISIRKFSPRKRSLDDLAAQKCMSEAMCEFLKIAAACRMNIIISGGTGSGKTTLLNAISNHINNWERIVTIEDAAELQLQKEHVVRLESQPAIYGDNPKEEITIRDLVKNALRMRPDRIILGEVRGGEAFDMLQAMNTGHEGSLATIHANHPRDALMRLDNIISMSHANATIRSIRNQVASAVHLIVQVSRQGNGQRCVSFISEIAGMEGDMITMNELFNCTPETKNGAVSLSTDGEYKWTGVMPRCLRRIAYYGELERLSKALGIRIPKI
ncbi:MAG: CpaF family protein [Rickettsiales bacterium]